VKDRKLGFRHAHLFYTSDSFAKLRDKVLELGAHRSNNVKGTGVDVREIIVPVAGVSLHARDAIVDLDSPSAADSVRSVTVAELDAKEEEATEPVKWIGAATEPPQIGKEAERRRWKPPTPYPPEHFAFFCGGNDPEDLAALWPRIVATLQAGRAVSLTPSMNEDLRDHTFYVETPKGVEGDE